MKKLKHESELLKKAIELGMLYGEKKGVVKFEMTDSVNDKIEYIYKLLVHDKLIQPLAKDQISISNYISISITNPSYILISISS